MEKEKRITAPEGCEIEKVEIIDGAAVIKFKEKERKRPKSWEEFCEIYPIENDEFYITGSSEITASFTNGYERRKIYDRNKIPDRSTAEAVLALCQLIQLRNAYNGEWVPDWKDDHSSKYVIDFESDCIIPATCCNAALPLYFKTEELRDEFLRNFRDLIEKLKPLYGIKTEPSNK